MSDEEVAVMLGGPCDGYTVKIVGPAPVKYIDMPRWQDAIRYRRTGERDEAGRAIYRYFAGTST